MSPQKNNAARGLITFHTPFHVSTFNSEEYRADVRDAAGHRGSPSHPGARTRTRTPGDRVEEASPSGPQPGAKQDRLSHTSLRRLKAKMEAENQQANEITQPLLDTENGFMKDLEMFLSHRDVTELRRRELLHKRWTERVWFPLQRRVEDHVTRCGAAAVKRRQSLYSYYLHHCNTRGHVFLETYDPREYNPFVLHIKKTHFSKLGTADLKDPLYLQLHGRLMGKRTAGSCETGSRYTRIQVEKLPQRDPPLCESAPPRTGILRLASSHHPASASRNPPVGDETEGRRSSGLDHLQCHRRPTWKVPSDRLLAPQIWATS